MQDPKYYPDSVARIIALLKGTFGDQFREYFDGEPEEILPEQLPCVMVLTPTIVVDSEMTGADTIDEQITIILAMNKMEDIGAKQDTDLTDFRLRMLILGQDPNTPVNQLPAYLPNSLMYVIRRNITLSNSATNNRVQVEFDTNVRGSDVLTREAIITISVSRVALMPSRV